MRLLCGRVQAVGQPGLSDATGVRGLGGLGSNHPEEASERERGGIWSILWMFPIADSQRDLFVITQKT